MDLGLLPTNTRWALGRRLVISLLNVGSGCDSVGRVTTEVCGSNPVIGKIYLTYILPTVLKRKDEYKEKEAGKSAI